MTIAATRHRCVSLIRGRSLAVRRPEQCGSSTWGADADPDGTSPYAAPGRSSDLRGLTPGFIKVNGLGPLSDEDIHYALRLLAAGVPGELYCAPNQHHAPSEDPRTEAEAARLYTEPTRTALGIEIP